jgi:hypothetical protein
MDATNLAQAGTKKVNLMAANTFVIIQKFDGYAVSYIISQQSISPDIYE